MLFSGSSAQKAHIWALEVDERSRDCSQDKEGVEQPREPAFRGLARPGLGGQIPSTRGRCGASVGSQEEVIGGCSGRRGFAPWSRWLDHHIHFHLSLSHTHVGLPQRLALTPHALWTIRSSFCECSKLLGTNSQNWRYFLNG